MDVREEDRKKNSCPSRGLGLAAAAIGVGVGAALYYIFSKRSENPDGEGSTTSGWTCEQPHTFRIHRVDSEDSYTTISENSTTDTSVYDCDSDTSESSEESHEDSNNVTDEDSDTPQFRFVLDLDMSGDANENSDSSHESSDFYESSQIEDSFETNYLQVPQSDINNIESEVENTEWDITNSSIDVPVFEFSPRRHTFRILRAARNLIRERTWSLEECSICFDIILKDQEVTTLPCTHHFHSACIAPWLQEQQTCPNCRKAAE